MAKKTSHKLSKTKPAIRLTKKEFWIMLRANAGIFSRTAKAIEKKFKIKYSRQAVRNRANKDPELLRDIQEENLDTAESGLHDFMKPTNKNKALRFEAIKWYLKCQAKKRGYVERSELTGANGTPLKTDTIKKIVVRIVPPKQ